MEVLKQHHSRHETPIPFPDRTDLASVDELEGVSEIRQHRQLILHLDQTYPALNLASHLDSLKTRSPSVDLRHYVVPSARQVPRP